jgi:hypothetical protein
MDLSKDLMLKALKLLETKLPRTLTLIVGGGGAMLLGHEFPLATTDIDAVPKGMTDIEVGELVKVVAIELGIPGDWLNPWYSSFTHVLPMDYESRLVLVYQGPQMKVQALGADDILLMKCFAHRKKDIPHARALVRKGADSNRVALRIEELALKKLPGTREALDFLDEILELEA